MKRSTKRAIIALDLASFDAPGLVSFARAIAKGLTNNANFTAADLAKLPMTVADLLTAATSLESTHVGRPTTPSKAATKLERDQAGVVMDGLTNIAAFVEGLANTKASGDVAAAEGIILSVGFQLKKAPVRTAKHFGATSPTKGAALVAGIPGARNAVRLLQYSTDAGKTWSLPIVVHGTKVLISGMKSGSEGLFQYATSSPPVKRATQTLVSGTEAQRWSDSASCVIS
jgi:hypothetical protein